MKAGDRVQVRHGFSVAEKTGTITKQYDDSVFDGELAGQFHVNFDDGSVLVCEPEYIEPIVPKYKKGDRVQVQRGTYAGECGNVTCVERHKWGGWWQVFVRLDCGHFHFDPRELMAKAVNSGR